MSGILTDFYSISKFESVTTTCLVVLNSCTITVCFCTLGADMKLCHVRSANETTRVRSYTVCAQQISDYRKQCSNGSKYKAYQKPVYAFIRDHIWLYKFKSAEFSCVNTLPTALSPQCYSMGFYVSLRSNTRELASHGKLFLLTILSSATSFSTLYLNQARSTVRVETHRRESVDTEHAQTSQYYSTWYNT